MRLGLRSPDQPSACLLPAACCLLLAAASEVLLRDINMISYVHASTCIRVDTWSIGGRGVRPIGETS